MITSLTCLPDLYVPPFFLSPVVATIMGCLQDFEFLRSMGAKEVKPMLLPEYGEEAWEVLQDRWSLL